MGSEDKSKVGTVMWADLTVEDAERIRDFYAGVAGWGCSGHDMGGYQDFCMNAASGATVAGICHARGSNASMPPQWLIYITVADVDACAQRCRELGGEVIDGPRAMGEGRCCVIRDPAGAVAALYGSS